MSRSFGGRSLTTRSPIDDRAAGDLLQPGDRPQRGGLAAPGRADEHHELAVLDVKAQVVNGLDAARVRLFHVIEMICAMAAA